MNPNAAAFALILQQRKDANANRPLQRQDFNQEQGNNTQPRNQGRPVMMSAGPPPAPSYPMVGGYANNGVHYPHQQPVQLATHMTYQNPSLMSNQVYQQQPAGTIWPYYASQPTSMYSIGQPTQGSAMNGGFTGSYQPQPPTNYYSSNAIVAPIPIPTPSYSYPNHRGAPKQQFNQPPPPPSLPPPTIKTVDGTTQQASSFPAANEQVWYCEPCDKEFTQPSAYEAHCANHEKCRHPGCSFSGTKKVVIAHYHGAHGLYSGSGYKTIEIEGGQKFRVLLGTSPDEIAAWRADRKKKFPTEKNVQKKQGDIDALKKAGGLVPGEARQRGKKRPLPTPDAFADAQGTINDGATDTGTEPASKKPTTTSTETEEGGSNKIRRRPCSFFARGACRQGETCTFSHDFEPKMCNFFLKTGRCNRGSRCTFVHDREASKKHREDSRAAKANGGNSSKDNNNDGEGTTTGDGDKDDSPGDDKENNQSPQGTTVKNRGGANKPTPKPPKRELTDEEARAAAIKKKGVLFLPKPLAGGVRGTLLKKLLDAEIRSEDNILLQCFRFIVSNNFMQPAAVTAADTAGSSNDSVQ